MNVVCDAIKTVNCHVWGCSISDVTHTSFLSSDAKVEIDTRRPTCHVQKLKESKCPQLR